MQWITSFLNNVRFMFFWILAHAVAGAIGLFLLYFWGGTFFGNFLAVACFEITLGILKHKTLRLNESMKVSIFLIDLLAWVLAGVLILTERGIAYAFRDPLEMSPVPMLDLLLWGGIVSVTLSIVTVLFGRISWPAVRLRVRQVKQYLADHFLLTFICLPCLLVLPLLFLIVISTGFLLYGVMIVAVFFAPIEHFQAIFQNYTPVYWAQALLGASSAGWVGTLTGLVYVFILPMLKKVVRRYLAHSM